MILDTSCCQRVKMSSFQDKVSTLFVLCLCRTPVRSPESLCVSVCVSDSAQRLFLGPWVGEV